MSGSADLALARHSMALTAAALSVADSPGLGFPFGVSFCFLDNVLEPAPYDNFAISLQ